MTVRHVCNGEQHAGLLTLRFVVLVLEQKHCTPLKRRYGLFRCECGSLCVKFRNKDVLKDSATCGCRSSELRRQNSARLTHGRSRTPEYKVWSWMRSRCNNPSASDYHLYGGLGVSVCERWDSFEQFYADMGPRPAGYSLDRIDVRGNYCPENCRWASSDQQANNKRTTVFVTYAGKTLSIAQWSRYNNWGDWVIRDRISSGWSAEEAVSVPLGERRCRP